MANMRLLLDDIFSLATLSAGSGTSIASTLPLDNCKFYGNSRIVRSTTPNETVIEGEWDKAHPMSALVLWRHNLTSNGTVRLELFSGPNQSGSLVFDSEEKPALSVKALNELEWGVDPLGATVFTDWILRYTPIWFPRVLARSFRLTLSDSTLSHIDVTRIYAGRYFEPRFTMSYGHSNTWVDQTEQFETADGGLYGDPGEMKRETSFQLDWINPSEEALLFEGFRKVGLRRDFFVSLYPESGGTLERNYSYAAKFRTMPVLTKVFLQNHSAPFVTREV